ncbi:AGE family epimerase/isomerase [Candidatus Vallotia tarda]|uniref:Mannose-6-phosphate isomerase n=1 Tax=Candidatus Vallotiella hemipterorum TaxID=1177213 RepID=A0A8D9FS29_9BURK|nr:AGE family epimerase/isomerase [Candidatus Vallotia tarda]CAD6506757.1 Mannose-6-phosphate isomerase [Candidatus Vallotia tarda]CAG7605126.1 Mannose-6-phosphate isomerase [Candidatus Vallotia tarda]
MNQLNCTSVRIDELNQHISSVILPVWSTRGFNDALGLPYDRISAPGQPILPTTRYRAMACVRQLYVFSVAGWHNHADRLFESLRTRFLDTTYGGWNYSIDAQGAPKETKKDLYTHAFIVFGCAEYFRHRGTRDALDLLESTLHVIETRFTTHTGLYNAVLSRDFRTVIDGPRQNPIMHLSEAYLSACDARHDTWFFDTLRSIAEQIITKFVHRPTGCITELPIGYSPLRIEPGHQFEWFYLTANKPDIFRHSDLSTWLNSAYMFSLRYGVSPYTGGVCTALNEYGHIIDSNERLWAQTEFCRALTISKTPNFVCKIYNSHISIKIQLSRFKKRFLRDYGWVESITKDSAIVRIDMPSTTPYHIVTMYSALITAYQKI